MRCRALAGAVGSGCAGLMMLISVTPAEAVLRLPVGYSEGQSGNSDCQRMAEGCDRGGRMGSRDVGGDCQRAAMDSREGSGGLKIATDIADGARVPPGQDIRVTLTWDPQAWSGQDLDAALACVEVKGGLDPDLSKGERPADNDGVMEYTLHVPDSIREDCDICVQGFLMGTASDGGFQQVTSDRRCFMSGPPGPPATRPPTPPVTQPPAPATTTTTAPRTPTEVGGITASQPSPAPLAPAPAGPAAAPGGELPRTGSPITDLVGAAGGLSLTLGGLGVIGGATRRRRGRTNR